MHQIINKQSELYNYIKYIVCIVRMMGNNNNYIIFEKFCFQRVWLFDVLVFDNLLYFRVSIQEENITVQMILNLFGHPPFQIKSNIHMLQCNHTLTILSSATLSYLLLHLLCLLYTSRCV